MKRRYKPSVVFRLNNKREEQMPKMRKIIIILNLIIVMLILPQFVLEAKAKTWYVRPSGGSYGNEDGTSYENAWDGFANINWDVIGAGDTLYLAGTFSSTNLKVLSGGQPGSDLWIRGDYSTEPGILSNVGIRWGDRDSQYITVYGLTINGDRITSGQALASGKYKSDDIEFVAPDKVRDYNKEFISRGFQPGMMFLCNSTASNGNRMLLIESVSDEGDYEEITINTVDSDRRINDEARGDAGFDVYWPTSNIRVENCTIVSNYRKPLVSIMGDNITIKYCELDGNDMDMSGALYVSNGTYYKRPENITIEGNYIHNVGSFITSSYDSHGIGIQGVDGLIIKGNYLKECATGIIFWHPSTPTRSIENWEVTYNYIEDTNAARHDSSFPGTAIGFSGANSGPYNTGGLVAYNVLDGSLNCPGERGYGSKGNGIRIKWEKEVKIYNNVIRNFDYAIVANGVAVVDIRNNIVVGSRVYHVAATTNYTSWIEDHNVYFPDSGQKFYYGGLRDFNDYNANHGEIVNQNSFTDDPMFVDPENGDFHLQAGSPARDAGVDVGLTQDFEGNPILQGPAPDIGAYEYVPEQDDEKPQPEDLADKTSLKCYNNVFNPTKDEEALIWVEIKEKVHIKLGLYDSRGRRIKKIRDGEEKPPLYKYHWDGTNDSGNVVGSGLYFVHIQAGDYKNTKKIVVVK